MVQLEETTVLQLAECREGVGCFLWACVPVSEMGTAGPPGWVKVGEEGQGGSAREARSWLKPSPHM